MILDGKLQKSELFKNWKEKNQEAFLSHYFSALNSDFHLKENWEVGYYLPRDDKMVVFVLKEVVSLKKEDEVFKKPGEKVEKLESDKVKLFFNEALQIFKKEQPKLFPDTQIGDGFVVLQTIEGKTLWNFSFITKSLKFINIKINSENGKIESHQTVELVQK